MIKWGKRGEIDELAAIILAFILGVVVLIIGAAIADVARSLTSQQSRLAEAEGAISYLIPSKVYCLGQTPLGDVRCTRQSGKSCHSQRTSSRTLWDPKLGSVRCSPKQPTNNTNGAIVGTLLSLSSGRARGIPIYFVERGNSTMTVSEPNMVGVTVYPLRNSPWTRGNIFHPPSTMLGRCLASSAPRVLHS